MPRITLAPSLIFIHHLRPRSVNEPGFFFVMLGDQFLSIAKRKGYLCHLPAQKFLLHALWQAAWSLLPVPTQITMKKSKAL